MEIDKKYANAYVEVLEILKYVDKQDYNKIPSDELQLLETYSNKNYSFTYNPEKSFDEQNVSETTKLIIAMLFLDYWANQKQKNKINAFLQNKRNELMEIENKKYSIDNVFNKRNAEVQIEEKKEDEEIFLVTVNNEKWYKKVLDFIRNILKK
ncbi:MAG: hypothetical protein IKO49_08500 [Bacilli bacterium]|nr:hypothetical protein [Clostridia bacterium]MBR4619322.1 hypothetical protein [Bacilli bacterium]